MQLPSESWSGKTSRNFAARTSQSGAKRFADFSIFWWFRLSDKSSGTGATKRLSAVCGMPSSLYVATNSWYLALVLIQVELMWNLFLQWILSGIFAVDMLIQTALHCLQGNSERTALRAFSSSGLEKVSSLRLVFLFLQMILGYRTLRLWSHQSVQVRVTTLPSQKRLKQKLHFCFDLAHVCSEGDILCERADTLFHLCQREPSWKKEHCRSVRHQYSRKWGHPRRHWWSWRDFQNLWSPRTSGPNISRSPLNCASHERWPTPSRSGPEPSGEPKNRRSGWYRRHWHVWSIVNTRHESGWETTKLGCRHRDKTRKAREQEMVLSENYGTIPTLDSKRCAPPHHQMRYQRSPLSPKIFKRNKGKRREYVRVGWAKHNNKSATRTKRDTEILRERQKILH